MERNDIENIKSNQSKQRSYRGAKRSGRGGAHGGAPALHPSPNFMFYYLFVIVHLCKIINMNPLYPYLLCNGVLSSTVGLSC